MKTALLVVDCQNWFINEHTRRIPARIASLIKARKFDFVLFSKYVFSKDSPFARVRSGQALSDPRDTDIMPELSPMASKGKVFVKNTFSCLKCRPLARFLKKNKVSRLYICGFDTDGCVLATAVEAFDLCYDVKVIADLCASHNGLELNKWALEIIRRNIKGALVNSSDL